METTTKRVMMRRSMVTSLVSLLMLVGMALLSVSTVGAQAVNDRTSCGHFETQADAQEVLDSGVLDDPSVLDWDGDGIACEEAFGLDENSPPPVRDYTSCGHFETQADAQEALDSGLLANPDVLDSDGDGIACEDAFGSSAPVPVTALPSTGTGSRTETGAGIVAGTLFLLGVAMAGLEFRRRMQLSRGEISS